jgi:single-stranded-DNA-specific exonuclease
MDGKHLKLRVKDTGSGNVFDAIAFGMGPLYGTLKQGSVVDIVYTIDMNVWNGNRKIQLKIKDVRIFD